jgi:hypothetical protein
MTSFRTSVRPFSDFHFSERFWKKPGFNKFCHFLYFKKWKKKKKMTDWLHFTDGRTPIHCIALYCITCIALHYIMCIALHCIALLTERNVNSTACLLLIVPSVTFIFFCHWMYPMDCVSVNVVRQLFWLRTSVRTHYWLRTELKLNWNNWNLSVHPWHSYILHWYFHFWEVKWLHSVRPSSYIQISILAGSWVRNLASTRFCHFFVF